MHEHAHALKHTLNVKNKNKQKTKEKIDLLLSIIAHSGEVIIYDTY